MLCSPTFWGWGGVGNGHEVHRKNPLKWCLVAERFHVFHPLECFLRPSDVKYSQKDSSREREDVAGPRGFAQHGLPLALSSEAQVRCLLTVALGIPQLWQESGL